MSSSKSPIPSGPTNAGTHNASTAQRSWSHSLYFRMIRAWRVGEIEFQCHLALFVISTRLELRLARSELKWSLKRNMMNSGGKEVRHQERRSVWCGVLGGKGECWWRWRSAEWNWGVQIQAKEHRQGSRSAYPAAQPIHAEQRRKGREAKCLEWNRGAPNQCWGGDWGAPILEDERKQKRQYGALNEISKC